MRIGIDLGGTKIEGAGLGRDGQLHARERVETPSDYFELLAAIAGLVGRIEEAVGPGSVGIGSPGTMRPGTGLMDNAHNTALQGRAFPADISERLGREVRVANDANCFALSEAALDGAAGGARTVFGVIVGTGCGGGVAIDGRVLHGANGNAGEWGHNPLPWATTEELAAVCTCGQRGCIELFLSGTGMARDHRDVTGRSTTAEQIAQAARDGDPDCLHTLDRYADRMARSLATVINLFDPDAIVLGGGVSHVDWLYEAVPARWNAYVFGEAPQTRLLRNLHGASSGLRGAAWLWPE